MEGDPGEEAKSPPGPSGPGSKLESLSKEDLVKFVKKHMLLNQKLKAKCEEFSQENKKLKAEQQAAPPNNDNDTKRIKSLEGEVEEMKSEREEMLAAYNATQDAQEKAASKIRELVEQIECMKMKDETLTSSFQFMQEELNGARDKTKNDGNSLDNLDKMVRVLEKEFFLKTSELNNLQRDFTSFREQCTCQKYGTVENLGDTGTSVWVVEKTADSSINNDDNNQDKHEKADYANGEHDVTDKSTDDAGNLPKWTEALHQEKVFEQSEGSWITKPSNEPCTERTMEFVSIPEKMQLLRTAVGSETITWELVQQSVKSFVVNQRTVSTSGMSAQAEEVLTLIARLDSLEGGSIVQHGRKFF